MKWLFYVIVFIYMFYRAVYGAKGGVITVETVKYDADKSYLVPGVRKAISCIASNKNQKLEWINPDGVAVENVPANRVFVQESLVSTKFHSLTRTRVPALVLVFTSVQVEDTGVWSCQSGDFLHNTSLCVIDPSRFRDAPPVTVDAGRSITLSCQVSGNPEPRIMWYRNGELITDLNPKYQIMMKYNSVDSEGLLTIASLTNEDSGAYVCEAVQESPYVDDCVHIETMNISLQVNFPPVFSDENETKIVYGTEGESIDLVCSASGYPIPTYTWLKDNEEFSSEFGEDKIQLINNGTEAVLTLAPNTYDWNQKYRCRAKNPYGDVYKSFMLAKTVKPTKPRQIKPVSGYDKIEFEVSWLDEMNFPVTSIDIQYFKARTIKGRKLKESDWMRSKLVEVNPDEVLSQGVYITLPDLDENTEYFIRLRAVNTEGKSLWSKPIVASTEEKPDVPEETEETEEAEETTAASETAPVSDSTFYGIFFAGGIAIIVIGAMFLMRMV